MRGYLYFDYLPLPILTYLKVTQKLVLKSKFRKYLPMDVKDTFKPLERLTLNTGNS